MIVVVVVNASCVADPSPCEAAPECVNCYSLVEVSTEIVVGDCNSTCSKYECQRDPCPSLAPDPPLCDWNMLASDISDICCPTNYAVCVPTNCPDEPCDIGYHKEVVSDYFLDDENGCAPGLNCCQKEICICDVCNYNGEQYNFSNTWSEATNSCIIMECTSDRSADGCHTITQTENQCVTTTCNECQTETFKHDDACCGITIHVVW